MIKSHTKLYGARITDLVMEKRRATFAIFGNIANGMMRNRAEFITRKTNLRISKKLFLFNMPTKIFTTIPGLCPFGRNVMIDSPGCRNCEHYYMRGTSTFFWCMHTQKASTDIEMPQTVPKTGKSVPKTPETGTQPKKRGRPPGKAKKKPIKTRKKKNG